MIYIISAAQCMIHFIDHFIVDSFNMGTLEPTKNQLSMSVASWHRYGEVTGSNPVEVLNFLRFSTQQLKLRS